MCPASNPPNITKSAPAPNAFAISPGTIQPPSYEFNSSIIGRETFSGGLFTLANIDEVHLTKVYDCMELIKNSPYPNADPSFSGGGILTTAAEWSNSPTFGSITLNSPGTDPGGTYPTITSLVLSNFSPYNV